MGKHPAVVRNFLYCCSLYQGSLVVAWISVAVNVFGLLTQEPLFAHAISGIQMQGEKMFIVIAGLLSLFGVVTGIVLFIALLRTSWLTVLVWLVCTVCRLAASAVLFPVWLALSCPKLECRLGAALVAFLLVHTGCALYGWMVVYSYYCALRWGNEEVREKAGVVKGDQPHAKERGSVMRQPEKRRRETKAYRLTQLAIHYRKREAPQRAHRAASDVRVVERARMQRAKRLKAGYDVTTMHERRTTHARKKGAIVGTFLCCCGLRQGTLVLGWLLLLIHVFVLLFLGENIMRSLSVDERGGVEELFLLVRLLSMFGVLACITLLVGTVKDEVVCLKVWVWMFAVIGVSFLLTCLYWIIGNCKGLRCTVGPYLVIALVVYLVMVVYAILVVISCYKVIMFQTLAEAAEARLAVERGPHAPEEPPEPERKKKKRKKKKTLRFAD